MERACKIRVQILRANAITIAEKTCKEILLLIHFLITNET